MIDRQDGMSIKNGRPSPEITEVINIWGEDLNTGMADLINAWGTAIGQLDLSPGETVSAVCMFVGMVLINYAESEQIAHEGLNDMVVDTHEFINSNWVHGRARVEKMKRMER